MISRIVIAIAADVHQPAAADAGLVADIRWSPLKYEKKPGWRARRRCVRPAPVSRAPSQCGCCRTMNASCTSLPVRSRAAISCALPRRRQRDRLLAKHVLARLQRADGPRHVQVVGQRVVDGVDRPDRPAAPRSCRRRGECPVRPPPASAAARSREAIAAMRQRSDRCIAGITFSRPILAVLITPQRTLSAMFCVPPAASGRLSRQFGQCRMIRPTMP